MERVLCDNGWAYRSYAWRDACAALKVIPKRTRPYRPQTNGKSERFHRTLADGWAYARLYASTGERVPPCRAGSTSTITTEPTPPSEASHRSPDRPTSLGIASSAVSSRTPPGSAQEPLQVRPVFVRTPVANSSHWYTPTKE